MNSDLSSLKNIGTNTIEWLHDIGITSVDDLRSVGAIEAYVRLKEAYPKAVSLNALWGLVGALDDMDWRMISDAYKADLKQQVNIAQDKRKESPVIFDPFEQQ